MIGKIHGACHTKPQKLYARHCVAKQCLGVYLGFVTDMHPSLVTDLPMHFDLVGIRMFRQGCHRQARGTTHRTTYATKTTFSNVDATPVLISWCILHPNMGNIRAFINCVRGKKNEAPEASLLQVVLLGSHCIKLSYCTLACRKFVVGRGLC